MRMGGKGERQASWLLIKEKDSFTCASADVSVFVELTASVKSLGSPSRVATARGSSRSSSMVTFAGAQRRCGRTPAGAKWPRLDVETATPAKCLRTLESAARPWRVWFARIWRVAPNPSRTGICRSVRMGCSGDASASTPRVSCVSCVSCVMGECLLENVGNGVDGGLAWRIGQHRAAMM